MKFSLASLQEKDLKIVEKKKIFFLVPAAILLIAIIAGIIFGVTTKSPLNLGMDFTGGYTITIRAGALINDETYDSYKAKIQAEVESFEFEYDNKKYGVQFEDIQRLGTGNETSLRIEYRADRNLPEARQNTIMKEINQALLDRLNGVVGNMIPVSVNINADTKTATVVYDKAVKAYGEFGATGGFISMLTAAGIEITGDVEIEKGAGGVFNTAVFIFVGNPTQAEIREAMTIDKFYSARAISGDMISGAVSAQLIYSAITAVLVALLLMLGYIFIRFEFASGVAAVIALLHDIGMMFAFMIIFHIEFNATFIAAIITILGYSINSTILIFDRVRELRKVAVSTNKSSTASDVCNRAILDTMTRCVYTSLTTIIMIGMIAIVCAIGGVTDMVSFAMPIIFGILAGVFSSSFLAPSLWVLFKRNKLGTLRQPRENKKDIKQPAKEATTETN